jgi:hypothetical protein
MTQGSVCADPADLLDCGRADVAVVDRDGPAVSRAHRTDPGLGSGRRR